MSESNSPSCIYCGRDQSQTPLVDFFYKDRQEYICTEHFPMLIHRPQELDGVLPGAEQLSAAPHDHD